MSHATHVLIRGHVFTYAEKAPFVASGKSVLGALEYDEETDRTRCHECGEWQRGLSYHVRKDHDMIPADYKVKHGLRKISALSGMKQRRSARKRAFATGAGKVARHIVERRSAGLRGKKRTDGMNHEKNNERGKCRAQIVFRLMTLAAQVGHTPTRQQQKEAGLTDAMLEWHFGSVPNALLAADLAPNRGSIQSLHQTYPKTEAEIRAAAEKWNAPMPWPKDHGRVSAEPRSATPLAGL